jgi:predicted SAM-dependent methyltransferase
MKVLNVGGSDSRHFPPEYDGWDKHVLDIDPEVNPDICCDAREMINMTEKYDSVYCSHNLEHFYQRDVPIVLKGFMHVLNDGGYIHIEVPNIINLMKEMLKNSLDINDIWYRAYGKPITFHDVLYGWSKMIEKGNEYYAHKCGFSAISLRTFIEDAGFKDVVIQDGTSNLIAVAFKR